MSCSLLIHLQNQTVLAYLSPELIHQTTKRSIPFLRNYISTLLVLLVKQSHHPNVAVRRCHIQTGPPISILQ